ncbi:hypothetical protein ACP70R_019739 [Stipagrostis hirtigluma subsp. patula]
MAMQHLLVVVVIVASILHASSTVDATTAYDVLAQNNLPRGLLPQGVQSYTLGAGGAFEVTLPGECNFAVTIAGKQYQFRYDRKVGGIIKSGSIHGVFGVRMQVAFAWLGFNQVDLAAGDQLAIQVERFTRSFPVSAFSASPRCN